HYADEPITSAQLGEFLYRVGRVADYWEFPVAAAGKLETSGYAPRPYPGAGAMYELELYCAVNSCTGVGRGLYRYEPQHHRLDRRPGPTADFERLLADAAGASGLDPVRLQVVVIVAARLPRIGWKYESIAYSLTLKDVGVLFATMYLSATAMGLAPCALG